MLFAYHFHVNYFVYAYIYLCKGQGIESANLRKHHELQNKHVAELCSNIITKRLECSTSVTMTSKYGIIFS